MPLHANHIFYLNLPSIEDSLHSGIIFVIKIELKMKNNDWKDRLNVVYSTNPDFKYETTDDENAETLPKEKQNLRIMLDKKNRGGKVVTLITGFIGKDDDKKELCRMLKTKCGVGGSVKEEGIIIQGDFKQKVNEILSKEGYRTRVI